jgi:N-acetylneuraminic acid mutarotase
MKTSSRIVSVLALMAATLFAWAGLSWAVDLPGEWQTLASSSKNRQEVAYVQVDGRFYLAGGSTLHERYDPATNSWEQVEPLPVKLDHIQGVELGGKIYYVGGLAAWPSPHVTTVYIYDPATDTFSEGTPMPESRGRGAGGVAVYDGKIYYAGGMHDGRAVAWFDVYDPATETWTQLPDMPRVRDHFHAAVVDGKFYAIGGRDSVISATTTKVDVYDLASGTAGTWQTPDTALPTPRGGFATAVLGNEILVIGGEGGGIAHNKVEAYDTVNNRWRTLVPMPTARHGIQAAVCNDGVYIAAGGKKQGGSSPTNVHEVFFLNGPTTCESPPGDTLPPVVKPPAHSLVTSPALGSVKVPVKISWSATDSGSGVSSYELQQSINGGAWTDVSLSSATQTSITLNLDPGNAYRFRVRGQDQTGNWSGWKQGSGVTIDVFQESDSSIGYVGTWNTESSSNAYGGGLKHANATGESAELAFSSASSVAWVASKGNNRGKAEVWVDGAIVKTVDLYNSATQWRKAVYVKNNMNVSRAHTVKVRALGTKSASSSGTRVDLDAFVVLSSP